VSIHEYSVCSQETSLAGLVKEFYLGDEAASMDTIHPIIDMFSDIIFWAGAHRSKFLSISYELKLLSICSPPAHATT
jgi:hypothetical protein